MVLRSTEIDSQLENDPENTLSLIPRILKQLRATLTKLNTLGFSEAIVVSDHGFFLNTHAEAGDVCSKPQGNWLNGSYGFLGTGGYSFNDFHTAALVTAYGRKILKLMEEVVRDAGGTVIELDTDGIFFSHPEPEPVTEKVQQALPSGIRAELELAGCGMYPSFVILGRLESENSPEITVWQ